MISSLLLCTNTLVEHGQWSMLHHINDYETTITHKIYTSLVINMWMHTQQRWHH